MPAYDHYNEARKIASGLEKCGFKNEASSIIAAIDTGISGTEIFMKLRIIVSRLLAKQDISPSVRDEMAALHHYLDEALK